MKRRGRSARSDTEAGPLELAIRNHLDLKLAHGAPEAEVLTEEIDALAPSPAPLLDAVGTGGDGAWSADDPPGLADPVYAPTSAALTQPKFASRPRPPRHSHTPQRVAALLALLAAFGATAIAAVSITQGGGGDGGGRAHTSIPARAVPAGRAPSATVPLRPGARIALATWNLAGKSKLYPFSPSSRERVPGPRDALPAFSDDGRLCAIGCRPSGAIDGWPLRPFHRQHPLRSGFNERRVSGFHEGIDIQARDGSPVYAMQPGPAVILQATGVDARVQVGTYIYWHIHPAVLPGEAVIPYRTVVGHVIHGAGHLHLSEVGPGGTFINPLRPGGRVVSPYRDTLPPVLAAPVITPDGGATVHAFDPQSFRRRTTYETPVIAPAAMAYDVFDAAGRRVVPLQFAFRGTHFFPTYALSLIYAPGAHSAGWTCFATRTVCVPDWRYNLAGGVAPKLTALGLPPGRYRLSTYAWDWAGNTAALDTRFELLAGGIARAR